MKGTPIRVVRGIPVIFLATFAIWILSAEEEEKDPWYYRERADDFVRNVVKRTGCFVDSPKSPIDFVDLLGEPADWDWCGSHDNTDWWGSIPGVQHMVSCFRVLTPDFVDIDLRLEFVTNTGWIATDETKIYSARAYAQINGYVMKFYLDWPSSDERGPCYESSDSNNPVQETPAKAADPDL